tara:strand:- start:15601 stop:16764 length:1164 start_codon:yes stop_codon:yes gene_type:complete
MFGVSILTWGTEDYQSNPFIKPLWAYQFGGSTGHAAIKLVLPIAYADLVEKYCTSDDDVQYVPHFKTQVFVPIPTHDDAHSYRAKEEDAIVVYFSVWPGKNLKYEFQDRFNGLFHTKEDSTGESKVGLEHSGIIHHPSLQATKMQLKIELLETDFSIKIEEYKDKVQQCEIIKYKLRHIYMENKDDLKHPVAAKKLRKTLREIKMDTMHASRVLLQAHQKLMLLKNEYYTKHCQYGVSPSHEVFLPLSDKLPHSLDIEAMLSQMRTELDNEFDFDLFYNNCSNFTRSILMAGITEPTRQALAQQGLMTSYDLSLALFDTPIRVVRTGLQAQAALSELNATALSQKVAVIEDVPAKTYLPGKETQVALARIIKNDIQTDNAGYKRSRL